MSEREWVLAIEALQSDVVAHSKLYPRIETDGKSPQAYANALFMFGDASSTLLSWGEYRSAIWERLEDIKRLSPVSEP